MLRPMASPAPMQIVGGNLNKEKKSVSLRKENGDMEIGFDLRGNLRPYEKITTSLDDFKNYFVNSFAGENQNLIIICILFKPFNKK